MGGIKNATEKRKREQLINFENIAAKQMKREGQNFSEKERFMTESYLRMLEENKQFELNDKQKEEWNKSHSAFNKSDMSAFYKKMYDQDMMFGGPRILEGNPEEQKQIEIEIEMGENSESEQELNEKERERSRSKEKETKNLSGDQNHDVKEEDNLIIDSSQKGLNLFVDSQLDEAKQMQVEEAPLTREEKIRQAKERLKLRTATLNNQKPEG